MEISLVLFLIIEWWRFTFRSRCPSLWWLMGRGRCPVLSVSYRPGPQLYASTTRQRPPVRPSSVITSPVRGRFTTFLKMWTVFSLKLINCLLNSQTVCKLSPVSFVMQSASDTDPNLGRRRRRSEEENFPSKRRRRNSCSSSTAVSDCGTGSSQQVKNI